MVMTTDFRFKPPVTVPDDRAGPERATSCPISEAEAWSDGIVVRQLSAWYGSFQAIRNVNLLVGPKRVTAVIGPSGCGKSTLIRCLNRMHEVAPKARVAGQVYLRSDDIYGSGTDPVLVRRRVGMVFQKPNPFPTMSVFDNVAAGLRLNSLFSRRSHLADIVEQGLRRAALWDEVKDKLNRPATELSGGQQQRLCIARALAIEPEVILMDEPCSALDPVATLKIEDLMRDLSVSYTIVIVTHNMQQAARVADCTAVMMMAEDCAGEMIEFGATSEVFTNPKAKGTEDYITGRCG